MSWFKRIWNKLFGKKQGSGGFDTSKLVWCFGGENGSNAKEDTSASGYRLLSATVSVKGITFKGTGAMWGYTHDKHDARNCIFFEEGGKWYGGFWEWGSVDRTFRGFDNIYGGYKGWNHIRFQKAKKVAFLVMDCAGRRRSNVIVADK